jgi:gamma-glutamyl-gamma-aminobutyrate hydrolase PuuD
VSGLALVTQRLDEHMATGELREALDVCWARFLASCGLLAVPVPVHTDVSTFATRMPVPDGIVWTGGGEVSEVSEAASSAPALLRDRLERQLLATFPDVPVLGVCRGAQHLAVLGGGVLVPCEGHVAVRHPIVIERENDWVQRPRSVNSFHCFAIQTVGAGFDVLARSSEGHVEAFIGRGTRRVGIVWHPEREDSASDDDVALVRSLFAAERKLS